MAQVTNGEKLSIIYGEQAISFEVNFIEQLPGKNKVKVNILSDGTVRVNTSNSTPKKVIKDTVRENARWISEQLSNIEQRTSDVLTREYISGESWFYLGRRHVLKVLPVSALPSEQKAEKAKLLRGKILVYTKNPKARHVKTLLDLWYKQRAHAIFKKHLLQVSSQLQWLETTPNLNIVTMKNQWGNCSAAGELSLNVHLVKAPTPCIEYVVLHELCHLKQKNHGPAFYQLLTNHMPNWQLLKEQLDEMSSLLLNE